MQKNLDSINAQQGPNANNQPIISPKVIATPAPKNINLLTVGQKTPGKAIRTGIILVLLIALGLGAILFWRAINLSEKIFVGRKISFIEKVRELIRGGDNSPLIGEDLGQVNILLLGIGGEGHEGPYLTDTMILAEIRPDLSQVVLISIPRDYLISLPGFQDSKINAAFAEGFNKNKDWGEAGVWARQAVEKISGLSVPYFAVVDFSGFESAINEINGVDVTIDRSFTDYNYPNEKFGYLPPVVFTQGQEHMDGQRALEFARSRHAEGFEGSDFARSLRQQKIINAFKEKVFKLNIITDAGRINSLLGIFADHFHTNIRPGELFRLYSLIKQNHINAFSSLSLDPASNLVCPKILESTGAYVLVPCIGKTTQDIENYFKNSFAIAKLAAEKSVIWLGNSVKDTVTYAKADKILKDAGLTVWEVPYGKSALPQNIFYQVNQRPATAEFIKNTLNATEVSLPPPGINADKNKVDIVIILGETK